MNFWIIKTLSINYFLIYYKKMSCFCNFLNLKNEIRTKKRKSGLSGNNEYFSRAFKMIYKIIYNIIIYIYMYNSKIDIKNYFFL
jgi:hypothetical protein